MMQRTCHERGCLCGAIAYDIVSLNGSILFCHCRTCRKAHAAPFVSTAGVLRESFCWLQGPELLLLEQLQRGLQQNPRVRSIRGLELMIGIELDAPCTKLVERALREQRLLITATRGNTLRLLPPLRSHRRLLPSRRDALLEEVRQCVVKDESFAIETTLPGLGYLRHIEQWQAKGYRVSLFFLSLPDADAAVARVAERVRQGGHNIPEPVIRRRFVAGMNNFIQYYRDRVNDWALYDNIGSIPVLLKWGENT